MKKKERDTETYIKRIQRQRDFENTENNIHRKSPPETRHIITQMENAEKREKHRRKPNKNKQETKRTWNVRQKTRYPYKQEEENAIYAADATHLLQQEPPEHTIARLTSYTNITATRQLKIQWGKAEMLTKKKNKTMQKNTQHHTTKYDIRTQEQYYANK